MVLKWKLGGKVEKFKKETHYRYAYATDEKGREERFKIGDCAWMEGPDKEVWVGMIIDFFDDPTERGDDRLRVILRWFYGHHHMDKNTFIEEDVPQHYGPDEHYFADDIDFGDNSLKVITGKVYVYQDFKEFKKEKKRGDGCYLVRSFYRPTPFRKPRLRKLELGELEFLLNNPSHEEMYDRYAKAYRSRTVYMPKKKQLEDGKIAKSFRSKKYHAGSRQLRKFATREHDEVDDEKPLQKEKEKEPGILDVLYSRSQRFRRV